MEHDLKKVEDCMTPLGYPVVRWICTCGAEAQHGMARQHAQRGHSVHARAAKKKESLQ